MSSSFTDVHSFDHKLEEVKIISVESKTKEVLLIKFKEKIKNNPSALEIFSTINVQDSTNNLNAGDILVGILFIVEKLLNDDDKEKQYKLIEEQLTDTKNLGPCAQGKSIRLYQIYKGLYCHFFEKML
jgi:hypothetical protein